MSQTFHHPAISQWFASYAKDLLGFFRRKIGEQDAPDLVQDVYLRALSCPAALEVREPRAFLFRIASNLVVDHHRRRAHRQCESDEGLEETVATAAPGPEQAACDSQRMDRFCTALAELPAPCRHAFLLNRFNA
jgi:RNA polymerase sigma-70 factor (ECF subfamily)